MQDEACVLNGLSLLGSLQLTYLGATHLVEGIVGQALNMKAIEDKLQMSGHDVRSS
jgi:hypothetical protein